MILTKFDLSILEPDEWYVERSFDGLQIRRHVSRCVHTQCHLKLTDPQSSKVVALEVSQSGNWRYSRTHTLAHACIYLPICTNVFS